jgi:prevent-host-death family protein
MSGDRSIKIRVNITEFRRRIAFYLGEVKSGVTVVICVRNVPVCKIVPLTESDGLLHV